MESSIPHCIIFQLQICLNYISSLANFLLLIILTIIYLSYEALIGICKMYTYIKWINWLIGNSINLIRTEFNKNHY